jgi:hypothetical protein
MMSKTSKVEGYSVIVFVPVREHQPTSAYYVGGGVDAAEAKSLADEIATEIRKHVGPDYIAARSIDIEPQVSTECEHCGYAWHGTPEDPDYNGGCCAPDEEDHLSRQANNGQFGVGAQAGGRAGR